MLKEIPIFINECLRTFKTTGSICPTSRWAAKQMVAPLRNRHFNKGLKILELGPGTGSVTRWILKEMNFEDSLSICEINSRFMDSLKKNLSSDPYYMTHESRVEFFCCPMQELEAQKYDLIVCAIPFLNLDSKLIAEIFNKIADLSHEKTLMTYYEYIGLRQIGKNLSFGTNRSRMKNIDGHLSDIREGCLAQEQIVWRNFLPVRVFTLKDLPKLPQITNGFKLITGACCAQIAH